MDLDVTTEGAQAPDGHVRLRLASQPVALKARWEWARCTAMALGTLSAALFVGSFFLPWWKFWLYAPQYPNGLKLVISLTGMGGDVHEIDLLNHYIGMKHLADAAPTERKLAGFGVALIAVLTLALVAFIGKKLSWIIALVAASFPLVFVADSFYWLYAFGHDLDRKAPLHIAPFTPQMFGNGQIGQFETFAEPAIGFWVAVAGVACAIAAAALRSRFCASCTRARTCTIVCPHAMILRDGDEEATDDEKVRVA
jgi:hypothetical protein